MHSPAEATAAVAPQHATVAPQHAAVAPQRALTTAGIVGLGTALPPNSVASDVIGERLGLGSGWIERRTGIGSRRRASATLRLRDLAADAARAALTDAGA